MASPPVPWHCRHILQLPRPAALEKVPAGQGWQDAPAPRPQSALATNVPAGRDTAVTAGRARHTPARPGPALTRRAVSGARQRGRGCRAQRQRQQRRGQQRPARSHRSERRGRQDCALRSRHRPLAAAPEGSGCVIPGRRGNPGRAGLPGPSQRRDPSALPGSARRALSALPVSFSPVGLPGECRLESPGGERREAGLADRSRAGGAETARAPQGPAERLEPPVRERRGRGPAPCGPSQPIPWVGPAPCTSPQPIPAARSCPSAGPGARAGADAVSGAQLGLSYN